MIGVERKRVADLVSSMTNRRLSGHQLRGMWQTYDYCYLIVEGMFRPTDSGGIESWEGSCFRPMFSRSTGVNYRQVDSYLSSLELKGRVIVCRTANTKETAALLASRYHWWQKRWDDHHSHDQIFTRDPQETFVRGKAAVGWRDPGLVERVAAQLPGIDRKAWDVGQRFRSVEQMILATEKDWMEIPGIGIGIATQVVKELRGNAKTS